MPHHNVGCIPLSDIGGIHLHSSIHQDAHVEMQEVNAQLQAELQAKDSCGETLGVENARIQVSAVVIAWCCSELWLTPPGRYEGNHC